MSDTLMRVQYRFPRSKKKRIRKKWAKREGNFRYITSDGGQVILDRENGCLFITATDYARLKAKLDNSILTHQKEIESGLLWGKDYDWPHWMKA